MPPIPRSDQYLQTRKIPLGDFNGAKNCLHVIQHHQQQFPLFGAGRAQQVGAGRVAEIDLVAEAADDIDLSGIRCQSGEGNAEHARHAGGDLAHAAKAADDDRGVSGGIVSYPGQVPRQGRGSGSAPDTANSAGVATIETAATSVAIAAVSPASAPTATAAANGTTLNALACGDARPNRLTPQHPGGPSPAARAGSPLLLPTRHRRRQ